MKGTAHNAVISMTFAAKPNIFMRILIKSPKASFISLLRIIRTLMNNLFHFQLMIINDENSDENYIASFRKLERKMSAKGKAKESSFQTF